MRKISYNVMKHEGSIWGAWYKVACGCGSDDHMLNVEFEYDKDAPNCMWIHFHKEMTWCYSWGCNSWYQRLWKRISCAFKMLFTGHIEVEESFILDGAEHLDSFICALNEGRQRILDHQNKLTK